MDRRRPADAAGGSVQQDMRRAAAMVLSCDGFLADVFTLVHRLQARQDSEGARWRRVVGIARGGVFPAQRVAEALALEYCEIEIKYYDGTTKRAAPELIRTIGDDGDSSGGENLLVVDDVFDSGGTALFVRQLFPKCHVAAVYAKPLGFTRVAQASGNSTTWGRKVDDKWIVFPWDQPNWISEAPRLAGEFRKKLR